MFSIHGPIDWPGRCSPDAEKGVGVWLRGIISCPYLYGITEERLRDYELTLECACLFFKHLFILFVNFTEFALSSGSCVDRFILGLFCLLTAKKRLGSLIPGANTLKSKTNSTMTHLSKTIWINWCKYSRRHCCTCCTVNVCSAGWSVSTPEAPQAVCPNKPQMGSLQPTGTIRTPGSLSLKDDGLNKTTFPMTKA